MEYANASPNYNLCHLSPLSMSMECWVLSDALESPASAATRSSTRPWSATGSWSASGSRRPRPTTCGCSLPTTRTSSARHTPDPSLFPLPSSLLPPPSVPHFPLATLQALPSAFCLLPSAFFLLSILLSFSGTCIFASSISSHLFPSKYCQVSYFCK